MYAVSAKALPRKAVVKTLVGEKNHKRIFCTVQQEEKKRATFRFRNPRAQLAKKGVPKTSPVQVAERGGIGIVFDDKKSKRGEKQKTRGKKRRKKGSNGFVRDLKPCAVESRQPGKVASTRR